MPANIPETGCFTHFSPGQSFRGGASRVSSVLPEPEAKLPAKQAKHQASARLDLLKTLQLAELWLWCPRHRLLQRLLQRLANHRLPLQAELLQRHGAR